MYTIVKKMKKILLVCAGLILAAGISEAAIRVIGGFNIDSYSGTLLGEDNWDQKVGFQAGVGYDLNLTEDVSLEIEGLFRLTGSRLKHYVSGFHIYTANYSLKEICVPLLLKASFGDTFSHNFIFGGALSYVLSHDAGVDGDVEIAIVPPETKTFYTSMIVGLGLEWEIGIVSLFVEARYMTALVNILTSSEISYRPNGATFLIGLGF